MRARHTHCGHPVRQWSELVLRASTVVLCLVIGQLPVAQAHDQRHHRLSSTPTQETGEVGSPGRMTIPDVTLVNQYGEQVRFYRDLVKDKAVAINFVYTTCTTTCPLMGVNFNKLQELMHDRINRDVYLISVSVDPLTDTPQQLQAWGKRFHAGPGWTLLTGDKHDVDTLLKALKVFTPDKAEHAPIVLIGNDATGVWTRVEGLASSATLAHMLISVSRVSSQPSAPQEAQRQ
jgi:protein SCO1